MKMDDKLIHGVLVRINRENQFMNLKTLAEISGISIGQLSKIERGIEAATNDTLECIFEALDIDYYVLKKETENIENLFKKLYEIIYFFESKEKAKITIDEINENYKTEFITIDILLANLAYNLTYEVDLPKASEIIDLLSNILDYMPLYQKQIYFDYCGVYFKEINRIDKAIYYLNLSLEINNNKMVTGMAYYHLGISYRKNHQILKSYNCMNQCKNIFFSHNNYKRSTMADLVIANIHSSNGEYDEALSLLEGCLTNYKRIDVPINEIAKIYGNMIWISILNDRYTNAISLIESLDEKILSILNTYDSFILYKIILFVYQKDFDKALSLCNNIKKRYCESNVDHNFIMYYYNLIKDNKSNRLKYLKRIKSNIEQSSTYIEYRLLFKLLNIECTTNNQLTEFKELLMKYIFNSF